jgi:ABC-type transporter Mla subunit MlaD
MRWDPLRVVAVAVLAALAVVWFVKKPSHKMVVKAYFGNAMSLRVGADVRLAGVEIGHVQGVRARPELKEAPAEVVMILPANGLNIPSDSTASLETAGGRTYVDIDVRHTSGAPIGSNAVLKTVATQLN